MFGRKRLGTQVGHAQADQFWPAVRQNPSKIKIFRTQETISVMQKRQKIGTFIESVRGKLSRENKI